MLITICRSGGFAGIEEPLGTIDTAQLQNQEASRLQNWVDDIARDTAAQDEPIGADMFRYDVTVQDDAGKRRVFTIPHTGDPAEPLPAPLRELLNAL